jgi:hypothetical protein
MVADVSSSERLAVRYHLERSTMVLTRAGVYLTFVGHDELSCSRARVGRCARDVEDVFGWL